jgi:hypothetical protein
MPSSVNPMKFSSFHLFHGFDGISHQEVYRNNIEIIGLLEELEFDGVWGSEHRFRDYGLLPSITRMLAFVAGRTETLRIGTGIVVLPLHNPLQSRRTSPGPTCFPAGGSTSESVAAISRSNSRATGSRFLRPGAIQ